MEFETKEKLVDLKHKIMGLEMQLKSVYSLLNKYGESSFVPGLGGLLKKEYLLTLHAISLARTEFYSIIYEMGSDEERNPSFKWLSNFANEINMLDKK